MQGNSALIGLATDGPQIAACYPVMAELRPHLNAAEFAPTVLHLMNTTGFELAYLDDGGIKAVAGFRVSEWLHAGKYLEIEDLVVTGSARSKGYGGQLFDWLLARAEGRSCRELRLLSGVKRVDAHRFYLRKGMVIEAHYFSIKVPV
ncbi:MAG TPA: GNAT family N-acetyltransferase [Steroidobacteraceae bacterium]|jgi:GNAT superfamily N-acetyltransferase|nr:GNAT family N-acetyltransferase [Steroidobacteraceae bacterium]